MFETHVRSLSQPAEDLIELLPDDEANPLPVATRTISVNTDGLVMVTTAGGQKLDVFIAAGAPFPLRVVKVWTTGTTAQGIRGHL